MRRLSPSNFPWLDAWCAVKRRFGSSLATVHKKNRKKVMKSAILKIEPPLERQEDLLFNETKKTVFVYVLHNQNGRHETW